MKTLVVTNDYPPREGGIQTFVRELLAQFEPSQIAVYTSSSAGADEYDAATGLEVIRNPATMLLPTPSVTRDVQRAIGSTGADRVLFGAAAPLGLMAPALRTAGATRLVGLTHGHETGWALLPGSRQLLRRIIAGLDVTTYITEYTRSKLEPVLVGADLRLLPPGVDLQRFHPSVDPSAIRTKLALGPEPVIMCISRLVPRKGQDVLIRALSLVRKEISDARLVIVGGGRDESRLRRLASSAAVDDAVVFAGRAAYEQLPAYYAAGDVFAMPARTRRRGLDVEGLGMVYLEAAATGKPVVGGTSGGAPEAVQHGVTGTVVRDPEDHREVARALIDILGAPALAAAMGAAGRAWVESTWSWQTQAERLRAILA